MMIKRFLFLFVLLSTIGFLQASIVILNGLTHNYKVEGGKTYKGKISMENTDNAPQNIKVYLQDFTYKADGSINYSTPLTNKKTNAGWIKLNTNMLTLKAKEKAELYYEITVPDQIGQAGSYWSVIIIEPVEDIQPGHKEGISITSIVRYAIQVITDYDSESAKPDLAFESVKIDKEDDRHILKIAIANRGNLYCKPIAAVEVYNRENGQKAGVFSSQAMGLLPSTSKLFYIDISKLPPDKYNAAIIATDEDENAFAVNVELEIKK